jgi:hypothetical protein
MTVPNISKQHRNFNEWLSQCPVTWYKSSEYGNHQCPVYQFIFDDVKEEDDD